MEKSTIKKLVIGVLIVSALSLATWYLVPKIKDALDKKNDDDKNNDTGTPDPSDPTGGKGDTPTNIPKGVEGDNVGFDPNYYLDKKSKVKITVERASEAIKAIFDAKKGWYEDDDENAVKAALTRCQTKADLSFVSEAFYRTYKKDLLEFLKSFLSKSEMETYVYSVTNKLK